MSKEKSTSSPRIISVDTIGDCAFESPLMRKKQRFYAGEGVARFNRVKDLGQYNSIQDIEYYELAGAREKIYFNPAETTVGIVTCGGLCPGLNDVIRAITFCAMEEYGVKRVLGFKYGYEGLVAKFYHQPMELNTDNTDDIHEKGGTMLMSSRGFQEPSEIAETLIHYKVDILFTIGGDGTLRGASDIYQEVKKRGLNISVIGIPKTIDNDIALVERSFGFQTAVEVAWHNINAAHAEAKAYRNGIGLVKLMGRHSGWIAASAALSNSNVNVCLIPEVPFDLRGPNGLLYHLERRLNKKSHAVIVVAEGAGQELMASKSADTDKSGNKRLSDIGTFLRDEIIDHFKGTNKEVNLKYFDPSYSIRSRPANATDSEYCLRLGNSAVHAGMAGKTNMLVGMHNSRLVHLPISMLGARKMVDSNGWLWQTVLQSTHQPEDMCNPGSESKHHKLSKDDKNISLE
ncbi:MAG: ATP-dependent 6-phosphofructokinase [Spartobacteria bacterium]|nr:ATP-dependent 6-phosphofructokinase [Spartobacteria bacterium]